jgi:hypothetical protein
VRALTTLTRIVRRLCNALPLKRGAIFIVCGHRIGKGVVIRARGLGARIEKADEALVERGAGDEARARTSSI